MGDECDECRRRQMSWSDPAIRFKHVGSTPGAKTRLGSVCFSCCFLSPKVVCTMQHVGCTRHELFTPGHCKKYTDVRPKHSYIGFVLLPVTVGKQVSQFLNKAFTNHNNHHQSSTVTGIKIDPIYIYIQQSQRGAELGGSRGAQNIHSLGDEPNHPDM